MNIIKFVILIFILGFYGCIGTDIGDPIPVRLSISAPSTPLFVGSTFQVDAYFTDENGLEQKVSASWESSNNDIFTVNNEGLITAIAEGSASLTASANGLNEVLVLSIAASKASLLITNFPSSLQVGKTFTARVNYLDSAGNPASTDDLSWQSSNTALATVDNMGTVTAIAAGQVTIIASIGELSNTRTLLITDAPVMAIEKTLITRFDNDLVVGETFQYEASFWNSDNEEDNTRTIQWISSDPSVLSIDQNGLGTAVTAGSATVVASVGSVASEPVDVSIIEPMATTSRTGTLTGSSYGISGTFTLALNASDELILTISNYTFTSAPGPYFYLANARGSVAGGVNLGLASASGNYEINITPIDPSVTINSFDWLVVWCEPFRITLGAGEISQ